jgi:hypothetical protein
MAITYKSITAVLSRLGTTTFTLDSTTEFVIVVAGAANNSGTSDLVCTAGNISSDAGVNVLTLQVDRTEGDTLNSLGRNVSLLSGKVSNASPGALNTGASACTLSLTFNNTLSSGTWAAYVIQCDMGASASHPYKSSEYIFSDTDLDPFDAFASMAVTSGGMALTFSYRHLGTGIAQNTSDGFTERADTTSFGGLRSQVQTKDLSGSENLALVLDPSTGSRYQALQAWYQEVNDCDINSAATAPFEPGETVAFTGTAMDASGAGARMRKVGGTSSYDALGTPSSVTSTTFSAAIPNRPSRTPYTSEDGTTHTVEFVGTTSGAVTGTATSAYTFSPPTGYARTTLTTPDLTSASLCYDCGWTCIAGDQIEYESTVNVSGTDVAITVNTDGTVTLDSTPDPLPSGVSFKWRAYDSASELWTGSASNQSDWATWSDGGEAPPSGGTGTGGPVRSPIRSPIRSAVRGTIH